MSEKILEVKNLSKTFSSKNHIVKAVDNVSFEVKKGETFSIVGESGCGKSTTGRLILRLIEASSGEVFFDGQNISKISKRKLNKIRPDMQIIFQDPYGSLNPKMTIGTLLKESVGVNKTVKKDDIQKKCEEFIESVGLEISDLTKYPHEFSGGQRQRICIARAISTNPKLIICDEAVSALDLLVQAQILNLLNKLKEKYEFSYIFISHNLSVIKHMSDRVAVMYFGKIVEMGTVNEIFENPQHQYTKLLLNSTLSLNKKNKFLDERGDDFLEIEQYRKEIQENRSSKKLSFKNITKTHIVECCK